MGDIALFGLWSVELGTVLVLAFQTDRTEEITKASSPTVHVMGNSPFARLWNRNLPRLMKLDGPRGPERWRLWSLSVAAEGRITRLAWALILIGGALQAFG